MTSDGRPEGSVKPVKFPVLEFLVAVVVLAAATFFTVSLVVNFGTLEIRPRAVLFPLILWVVGITALIFGFVRLRVRRLSLAARAQEGVDR